MPSKPGSFINMRKYLKYLLILLLIPFLLAVSLRITNEGGGNSISVVNTKSSSLTLDGVDDNVDCGDIMALNSVTTFTITGWANQNDLASGDIFVNKEKDSSNRIVLYTWANNMYIDVSNLANRNGFFVSSTRITANTWFHFAIIYDGTGSTNADKLKLYIDNSEVTLTYNDTIPTATSDLTGYNFVLGDDSQSLNGQLADVRIFNRALFPAEITRVYRGDVITNGLVGAWPLQEGGLSEIAYDVSGEDNHGDLTNFTLSDGWANVQNVSHYNQQMGHSTEILGGELATNGTFDTDTGWTKDPDWTISGGTANFSDGGDARRIYQNCGIESTEIYKVEFTISSLIAGFCQVIVGSTDSEAATQYSSNGQYTIYRTAAGNAFLYLKGSVGGSFSIDDVSIKKITNDVPDGAKIPALADGSGIDAIGNAINNPGRGYNKSQISITN